MRVVIENRSGHDGAATGGHYGSWSRIWASRPEIVHCEAIANEHNFRPGRLSYHSDYIEVELTVHNELMREDDYVLIEWKRSANPFIGGSSRAESYELVAGKMPAWADFPKAWREWVNKVNGEAVSYLIKKYPELAQDFDYAMRKSSKNRIYSAWASIADEIGKIEHKDMSKCYSGYSWTAVYAIPVKIALRTGWKPSIPKPIYQTREEANPVLIASPKGVFV